MPDYYKEAVEILLGAIKASREGLKCADTS